MLSISSGFSMPGLEAGFNLEHGGSQEALVPERTSKPVASSNVDAVGQSDAANVLLESFEVAIRALGDSIQMLGRLLGVTPEGGAVEGSTASSSTCEGSLQPSYYPRPASEAESSDSLWKDIEESLKFKERLEDKVLSFGAGFLGGAGSFLKGIF